MNNLGQETSKKILMQEEIESVWGASATFKKISFSTEDVPSELRQLIPYAMLWGIPDDSARGEMLRHTPADLKMNLKWVVEKFDDQLDLWLAGPEASNPHPSKAYVAFSAMRMAADFI